MLPVIVLFRTFIDLGISATKGMADIDGILLVSPLSVVGGKPCAAPVLFFVAAAARSHMTVAKVFLLPPMPAHQAEQFTDHGLISTAKLF